MNPYTYKRRASLSVRERTYNHFAKQVFTSPVTDGVFAVCIVFAAASLLAIAAFAYQKLNASQENDSVPIYSEHKAPAVLGDYDQK